MSPPRKKQKQAAIRGKDRKFTKGLVGTTPTEPASERLLAQVETVEQILLNLPMRDLLLAARVCKRFLNIFAGSVKLSRALFFEPVACGSVSYLDWRYDDKEMYPQSMDLGEHIRGEKHDKRPDIYPRHWGKNRDDNGTYRIFVNPLLAEKFSVLQKNGCYFKELEAQLPAPMRYPFASWRRMYFTQPPVDNMILEWDSGPDPAIEADNEEDDQNAEDEDDDNGNDNDNAAAAATNPIPTTQAPAAAAPNAAVPAGPVAPWLPAANAGGAGNAGAGSGGDADWTVTCFSKWVGFNGIYMDHLFFKLEDVERPAWIEGRDLWEEYRGADDLEKVVVGGK